MISLGEIIFIAWC